jgi:hypothetical protein
MNLRVRSTLLRRGKEGVADWVTQSRTGSNGAELTMKAGSEVTQAVRVPATFFFFESTKLGACLLRVSV